MPIEVLPQAEHIEAHLQAVTLQVHPEAPVATQVEVTPAVPADPHHQEAQAAVQYADAKTASRESGNIKNIST